MRHIVRNNQVRYLVSCGYCGLAKVFHTKEGWNKHQEMKGVVMKNSPFVRHDEQSGDNVV